jgi:hypothetical protein
MTSPGSLRAAALAVLIVGLGLLLVGCGGDGGSAQAEEKIALLSVDAPLREPTYINKKDFVLALRENEPQVARFAASAGAPGEGTLGPEAVTSSEELEGNVTSMAPNPLKADEVYLPQPDLNRVVLMNTLDLQTVRSFDFNEPPQWAVVHPGSQTLFALSEDGSTVSVLDLEDPGTPFDFKINAGEEARIDAPQRGLEPQFWAWGPDGISHYAGFPPDLKVSMPINAAAFAVDIETAQRVYVGEGTSSRVVALEGDADGFLNGELREVAEQDLGERAEYLEAGDLRVTAATQDSLVEMKRDTLDVLETTEFRSFLEQQGLGEARVSGMTVTGDRVYLTLEGEPYMLSIRKTDKTRA